MTDGSTKQVLSPSERMNTIRSIHEAAGHFGRKHTIHLVLMDYWWPTLHKDVAVVT
jgi:hypothetical protein